MSESPIDALDKRVTHVEELHLALINILDRLQIEMQAGFAEMRKELTALRQENQRGIAALRDENRVMLQILDERLPSKREE